MKKILFVCHGNICRSPMAEFIFKDLADKAGAADLFYVESAATSTEEIGNPVYPPARQKLAQHGISCAGKQARRFQQKDYDFYDLLLVMDRYNYANLLSMTNQDPDNKIHLLLDFTARKGEISDPWYTRDFERAYQDILAGCTGLLDFLTKAK